MKDDNGGVAINVRGIPEETRRKFKAKCAALGILMSEALAMIIEDWCCAGHTGDINSSNEQQEKEKQP